MGRLNTSDRWIRRKLQSGAPREVVYYHYLAELRRLGDPPDDPPTSTEVAENGRYHPSMYYHHFDSWPEALRAAGYPNAEDGRRNRTVISDEELIFDLRAGAAVLGWSPSYDDYQAFGTYSAGTLANRFGSWPEALEAADLPETRTPVDLDPDDIDPPEGDDG